MIKVDCDRCIGKGIIHAFLGTKNGICFKCAGHGFVTQKNKPRIQKTFTFSFLWLDKDDCNYNDGDFCLCFSRKQPSMNKAILTAKAFMNKNGSSDFKVELKQLTQ